VLQEVAAWRECEAQARDIPRQRVVADRVLAEIAKRSPKQPAQIERLRGLHPREAARSSKAILEAVRRGVERPEADVPDWGMAAPHVKDARVEMIAALLDAVLRGVAARMNLSSRLLANRRDLEALARYRLAGSPAEPDVPVLSGWRRESVGDRLLQVLHGEVAVVIDDHESLGPQLQLTDID
jgi:ribonuclease D